jgi:hypothetical protein
MKKENILRFCKELIYWGILLAVLQLVGHKQGWTGTAIRDSMIGLTIVWIAWRGILAGIRRKKK